MLSGAVYSVYFTTSGVAQGSILGPFLFSLAVNNLADSCSDSFMLQYADDIKVFRSIASLADAASLQADINAIVCHLYNLGLCCNPSKTTVVTYSQRRSVIEFDYTIDGAVITRASVFKDLGVYFDSKLSFRHHLDEARKRSLSALSCVLRLSKEHVLPFHCKRALYFAYIFPHFTYASVIWNSSNGSSFKRLAAAHRRCIYSLLQIWPCDLDFTTACDVFNTEPLSARLLFNDVVFLCNLLNSVIDAPDLLSRVNFNIRSAHYALRPTTLFNVLGTAVNPITRLQHLTCSLLNIAPDFDIFYSSRHDILSILRRVYTLL